MLREFEGKKVDIMCTSDCNTNCEHCYVCYKGRRDPDELLDLVSFLKDKYKVMLNGAEVLTNPEYLKSYKEIHQPWILSNGLAILNPKIVEKLKENEIKSVSMSYHFGIHDEISKVSTEKLKKVMKILRENELEYRFMTTITSKNYMLIEKMCEESIALGAKGIMFTNFLKQGHGENLEDLILKKDQLKDFFEHLKYVRSIYKKSDLIIERNGNFGPDESCDNNKFCCEFGTNSVFITPDNNVYPCIFLTKPGYEIGKLIDKHIYIEDKYYNDEKSCIVDNLCNKGIALKLINEGK